MTIEDLKNAKLSEVSRGYLAIYLKLSHLYDEASGVTGLSYSGLAVDDVNDDFITALSNAQDEIMKLFARSLTEKLCMLDNHTEL